jgi:WD40 repeat protein
MTLGGVLSEVYLVFWTPDNRLFASNGHFISVFDMSLAELYIQSEEENGWISYVDWSPSGEYISRGFLGGTLNVYDSLNGEIILSLPSGGTQPQGLLWSPDGTRVATFDFLGTINVWDAETGELQSELSGEGSETTIWRIGMDWSPDGSKSVSVNFNSGLTEIFDAVTGERIAEYPSMPNMSVSWSPVGDWIASVGFDGSTIIWDPNSGEIIKSLLPEDFAFAVTSVAWSHDGALLSVISNDGIGRVFDTASGEIISTICCHESLTYIMSWAPGQKRFLTASSDGTVKVWDAVTGANIFELFIAPHTSAAFSPDGSKILIAADDGTLRVYRHYRSHEELIAHAKECCIVRELTPEEREQFGLPPSEGQEEPESETSSLDAPYPAAAAAFGLAAVGLVFVGRRMKDR